MTTQPEPATWRIGLASVPNAPSVAERLETARRMMTEAMTRGVDLVCFPETFFPGLRGMDFDVPVYDHTLQKDARHEIASLAGELGIGVILPMEWKSDAGQLNLAWVIS